MDATTKKHLQIFSGRSHEKLAQNVAKKLGVKLCDAGIQQFANGEIKCQLSESVRGSDVFIIQTHGKPVNEAVMEQAILIDAAKRASAKRIIAVCPLLGYSRQDRKSHTREPITSKLVIDILSAAGADRIVSVDLHTGQIQAFFDGPFDHLIAQPVISDYLKRTYGSNFVLVSPDAGGVKNAQRHANQLGVELAVVHKYRPQNNQAEVQLDVIGNVKGKHCIIVDDMIDTAGTICAAAEQLKKHGALSVAAAATHGIFSPPAAERLVKSAIDRIIVTDTLPAPDKSDLPELVVLSIVDTLATAIQSIFEERSVSEMFGGENQA